MRDVFRTFVHLHPTIKLLLVGNILLFIGVSMTTPFLAIYLSKQLGLSATLIGTIIGLGSIAGIVGGFIGGVLSDRFGHKPLLILSLLFTGVIYCGYAIVDQVLPLSLLVLLAGCSNAVFQTVSRTVIAELSQKQERSTAFSFLNFTLNVGWAIGPLLAVALDVAATTTPFLIAAVIFLLYGFLLAVTLRPEQSLHSFVDPVRMSFGQVCTMIMRDANLRLYVTGGILLMTGLGQFTTLLSQHLAKTFVNGTAVFSILLAINALFIVVFQLPLASFTAKKHSSYLIKAGTLLIAGGLVGFGVSPTALLLYGAMVIFSLAEAIVAPLQSTILDEIAPAAHKGAYFGAQNITFFGAFIGPVFGGFLLDRYGGTVMYLALASLSLISMYFFLKCLGRPSAHGKATHPV
ncbi:MDR family MFS transporter [Brevibacillus migulae]|uniref:MDR family MFS transporter n=1 Tax=Brevibacillus migulae TaxID=1644114 RepID=UPI00106E2412|nr:MFS transporter [Brevibacillus migulae]